jgi:hypothetical protein
VSGDASLPESLRTLPKLTRVRIELLEGGEFTVEGFGLPFAHPGHPSDAWINQNAPIIGGVDLLSLLRRRTITFLVSKPLGSVQFGKVSLPEPFRYPFDYPFAHAEKTFFIDDFRDMVETNKV